MGVISQTLVSFILFITVCLTLFEILAQNAQVVKILRNGIESQRSPLSMEYDP